MTTVGRGYLRRILVRRIITAPARSPSPAATELPSISGTGCWTVAWIGLATDPMIVASPRSVSSRLTVFCICILLSCLFLPCAQAGAHQQDRTGEKTESGGDRAAVNFRDRGGGSGRQ